MKSEPMKKATATLAVLTLSALSAAVPANQGSRDVTDAETMQNPSSMQEQRSANLENPDERRNTRDVLDQAGEVLTAMERDKELQNALRQAKGVFLVPDFGRGALVLGGRGGQGVVFTKQDGDWNGPAFYNFGAVSAGAQGGVSAGQVAMLLMTDEAVDSFKQDHNFALNADAGLTLIDWSGQAQGSWGKGDVVLWSDTEGVFAGGAISVSDVFADEEANQEFYSQAGEVNVVSILQGDVDSDQDVKLIDRLP